MNGIEIHSSKLNAITNIHNHLSVITNHLNILDWLKEAKRFSYIYLINLIAVHLNVLLSPLSFKLW